MGEVPLHWLLKLTTFDGENDDVSKDSCCVSDLNVTDSKFDVVDAMTILRVDSCIMSVESGLIESDMLRMADDVNDGDK